MADWRHDAACRDYDPELFFPVGTGLPAQRQAEQAQAVCATCPVQAECLDWAITHADLAAFGVWGGLTEEERRAITKRTGGAVRLAA